MAKRKKKAVRARSQAKSKGGAARPTNRRRRPGRSATEQRIARMLAPRGRHASASGLFADLTPDAANFAPLTPVSFLPRTAEIHPDRIAVIHGARRYTYRQFYERARRLASALARRGVQRGDVVSAMLPNVPAMLDAHYGVPMLGAVLNTINTRLDADTVAYILEHGEAKVFITDRVFAGVVGPALAKLKTQSACHRRRRPALHRARGAARRDRVREIHRRRRRRFRLVAAAIGGRRRSRSITPRAPPGDPKGVVYHHRGTFLESLGNIVAWPMPRAPGVPVDAADVSLQRLVLSPGR